MTSCTLMYYSIQQHERLIIYTLQALRLVRTSHFSNAGCTNPLKLASHAALLVEGGIFMLAGNTTCSYSSSDNVALMASASHAMHASTHAKTVASAGDGLEGRS